MLKQTKKQKRLGAGPSLSAKTNSHVMYYPYPKRANKDVIANRETLTRLSPQWRLRSAYQLRLLYKQYIISFLTPTPESQPQNSPATYRVPSPPPKSHRNDK